MLPIFKKKPSVRPPAVDPQPTLLFPELNAVLGDDGTWNVRYQLTIHGNPFLLSGRMTSNTSLYHET